MTTEQEQLFETIEQNNRHIPEEMKKLKYEKMLASPFTFFRATNHLFWKLYANDKRINIFSQHNHTWLQGDLHVYNFGIFHNQQNQIIYNINDFDETIIADYQFDLWRFAASILLACRSETDFSKKKEKKIIKKFAKAYLKAVYKIIEGDKKEKKFITVKNASGELKEELKRVTKKENRKTMLNKWTNMVDGDRKFDTSLNKLQRLDKSEFLEIEQAMTDYVEKLKSSRQFRDQQVHIKDIVKRLYSGLGSFGVPRYYVLLEGKSSKPDDDILLDVKWQSKPTAYHLMDETFQNSYNQQFENEGQRFVQSYLDMIKFNDPYLGWLKLSDGVYSVMERSPFKSYVPIEELTKKKKYYEMVKYWAQIIASYQLLSGNSFKRKQFVKLTQEREKEFRNQIYDIAQEYAQQVEHDWSVFRKIVE